MAWDKGYSIGDRGRGRRGMVYVLEAGVTWDMGRGHSRRALLWLRCVVCLVRCGSVLIFVFVFVVAFAAKIFRSFVFMGRAELQNDR